MSAKKKELEEFKERIRNYIENRISKEGIKNLTLILQDAHEEYIKGIKPFVSKDPEQSWKPFNGKILEDVILKSISASFKNIGLKIISGNKLNSSKLNEELSIVKRNVVVNFGKYGMHLPDVDLVAYRPNKSNKVEFIISSKTSIRERIAQTGYWKLKLLQDPHTKHIKVFFITLDKKGELITKGNVIKKGRAIAETDTDGTYVITDKPIAESKNVKKFDKFFKDVEKILNKNNKT